MVTTKTIGPIHFEDLDPKRFEDLIRQLIYDFRPWRQLEPTGRSGSDDGFDVRAWEITTSESEPLDNEDEDDPRSVGQSGDRKWLVQCKRERTITPKKLAAYLDAIPADELSSLHGIIFAAACDFSKAARDMFREKTHAMGLAEFYLWGKADIEDVLFQAKNDHLLFAYFGFSIHVRKRSLKTEVRAILASKRKALAALTPGDCVIIRDVTDERYPWSDENESLTPRERGRWMVLKFKKHDHDGLHFVKRRHFAYIEDDNVQWDFAETMNDAPPHSHDDPWYGKPRDDERFELYDIWNSFPADKQGWFEISIILPYEEILDVDKLGDAWSKLTQILTGEWRGEHGPFRSYRSPSLSAGGQFSRRFAQPEVATRIKKFPRKDDPVAKVEGTSSTADEQPKFKDE